MFSRPLNADELQFWKDNHYLVVQQPFTPEQRRDLQEWTNEMIHWPEIPGRWMKYFEASPLTSEKMLCRIENFLPFHAEFRSLLQNEILFEILEQLMGEPATIFKEKINLKLPGGGSFGAHQDAPAFVTFGQRYHVTMMLAIDDSTVDNGCLQFSSPVEAYDTLPQNPDGTICSQLEKELVWRPLEVNAGDVVLFDSYLPHRSPPNPSQISRRAGFITYNRQSEGNRRDDYFADKRRYFPPECERIPGRDYSEKESLYNLGNPIR